MFSAADWFPESHPPMPEVVAHGRQPGTYACAFCHLPTGLARPENESITGLPAAYIVAQVQDFRNGLRRSSDPNMTSVVHMTEVAKAVTDDDLKAAADYYSSLKPAVSFRVVETDSVPETHIVGFMLQKTDDGATEPIGNRVIELPEDSERTEMQDPTSGFVVYVPKGSVKKGEAIVATGDNGNSIPCATCHGADLRGMANIPSIAGRSAVQMARQLIDFQTGARNGANSVLMKPVVAKLTDDDVASIVAYLSSKKP
jgi:cytochrome c553